MSSTLIPTATFARHLASECPGATLRSASIPHFQSAKPFQQGITPISSPISTARPSRKSALSVSASIFSPRGPSQAVDITSERSDLVNRENVLFLFQLEMDSQIQRALTYEDFETVKEVRSRRQQVDQALNELQESKGYGCGARHASRTSQIDFAPQALTIRSQLADAITEERYADAASLRDQLQAIEEKAAEAELPCPLSEPKFTLGQMVVHNGKGYRGVVCGWDLACCEDEEWQKATNVAALVHGADQVFYHVLVDVADWPDSYEEPPVAYVAAELLDAASMADFESEQPLVDSSFQHPYAYLMFLGSDGHGNMIPARQLRDKYCVQREDRYGPGQEPEWEDSDESDDGGFDGGFNDGPFSSGDGNGLWNGGPNIPGIDMRSLDD